MITEKKYHERYLMLMGTRYPFGSLFSISKLPEIVNNPQGGVHLEMSAHKKRGCRDSGSQSASQLFTIFSNQDRQT